MVTREFIQDVQQIMNHILAVTKKKQGSCLYMGALLFAQIQDNFNVTPKFVTGSVTLNNKLVFSHENILPVLRSGLDISLSWGGHAWVEFDNLIFDPSVFWTIYSESVSEKLQYEFEKAFNGKFDYLIGARNNLNRLGVTYKVHEELSDNDATILINSGCSAGFFDKRIC